MIPKAAFNLQLQGYTPANRDATVRLVNQVTGAVVERKPFLDGSLLVRDLEPGPYELEVRHPNLAMPIDRRIVRLFPQPAPTFVPIPVPEALFRDTPIRDIPDADLTPVQQTASAARDRLRPLAAKGPGEAIRAADWNTLVGAVVDLSSAILDLTALVSPRGHDHPEIAEKTDEVQGNLRRFAEAFGRSLLELRREIETENLRKHVDGIGELPIDLRTRLLDRITDLQDKMQVDTPVFTQKLATTGAVILNTVNEAAVALGPGGDAFLAKPEVKQLADMARFYTEAGSQTRPESELQTYQRTMTAAGGTKLVQVVRR